MFSIPLRKELISITIQMVVSWLSERLSPLFVMPIRRMGVLSRPMDLNAGTLIVFMNRDCGMDMPKMDS